MKLELRGDEIFEMGVKSFVLITRSILWIYNNWDDGLRGLEILWHIM